MYYDEARILLAKSFTIAINLGSLITGVLILTVTIRSPLILGCFMFLKPSPRQLYRCPCCVPARMFTSTLVQSIFSIVLVVPSIASKISTLVSVKRFISSLRNLGCLSISTIMIRSPLGAFLMLLSP